MKKPIKYLSQNIENIIGAVLIFLMIVFLVKAIKTKSYEFLCPEAKHEMETEEVSLDNEGKEE